MDIQYSEEAKIFKSVPKTVYICHGECEFLQKELAKKIIIFLMSEEEQATGLLRFDGNDEGALDKVIDAALSPSLFAPKQVIYVDNAQAFALRKKQLSEEDEKKKLSDEDKYTNYAEYARFLRFLQVIQKTKSGVNLVLICNGELKRTAGKTGKSRSEKMLQRAYAEVDKCGTLVRFPKMFESNLVPWIQDRARRYGLRMTGEQAEKLLEWGGEDVRHLASEIEKLAVLFGAEGKIDAKEFRRLVTSSEDKYVYQIVEHMFDGKAKAALGAFRRSLESGADPVYIAIVVGGRLRALWQARYLLDKGYFKNLPDVYKFGGNTFIPQEISRITEADKSVLAADKTSSILGKTAFAVYNILMPARRYKRELIEEAVSYLMDVERRLKGISRPKHGTDEIMIQNFIVDIAKLSISAEAPN